MDRNNWMSAILDSAKNLEDFRDLIAEITS